MNSEMPDQKVKPYVSYKYKYECKVPMTDGKRDTFYKKGGTYNTYFTPSSAQIDASV